MFDNIQPLFMIKTLNTVGIESNICQHKKVIHNKLIDNIILNDGKQSYPSESRKESRIPILVRHIQHYWKCWLQQSDKKKTNKRNPNGKGRSELLLFASYMTRYIENIKESPKKVLEPISSCWSSRLHDTLNIKKINCIFI